MNGRNSVLNSVLYQNVTVKQFIEVASVMTTESSILYPYLKRDCLSTGLPNARSLTITRNTKTENV